MPALIVNDDLCFRDTVARALVYNHYQSESAVCVATDGELALGLMTSPGYEHYDLIITGGNLQGEMKGPELIHQIRKLDGYQNTPIFIASQHPRYIIEGIRAGATAFMERPLDNTDEFIRRILEILHAPFHGSRVFFRIRPNGIIEIRQGEKLTATLGKHKQGFQVVLQPDGGLIEMMEDSFEGNPAFVLILPNP